MPSPRTPDRETPCGWISTLKPAMSKLDVGRSSFCHQRVTTRNSAWSFVAWSPVGSKDIRSKWLSPPTLRSPGSFLRIRSRAWTGGHGKGIAYARCRRRSSMRSSRSFIRCFEASSNGMIVPSSWTGDGVIDRRRFLDECRPARAQIRESMPEESLQIAPPPASSSPPTKSPGTPGSPTILYPPPDPRGQTG